jgi:hypothetical protein
MRVKDKLSHNLNLHIISISIINNVVEKLRGRWRLGGTVLLPTIKILLIIDNAEE